MKSFTALSIVAGLAAALPADSYGEVPATTTYACNPAHAYPNGASCISTAGSLTLVTPSGSATPSGDKETTCSKAYDQCRTAPDANFSYCASKYAECLGYNPFTSSVASSTVKTAPPATTTPAKGDEKACSKAYDQCRGAPDANFSYCASKYAECLGYNPFTSSAASSTVKTAPPATTSTTPAKGDEKACSKAYDQCRGAPDANFAYCASKYAECLGYNPFANNGTNTVTPKVSDTYVTQVVTRFTTYCPEPTILTYQSKTYTVTSATTLTISDCPCTITTPIQTGTAKPSVSVPVTTSTQPGTVVPTSNAASQTVSAPSTTRSSAQYTGAADKLQVGGALMLGALGLLAM